VLDVLVLVTRDASLGRHVDPVPQRLSRRVGRALIDGLLVADRGGGRVRFSIPDRLGAQSRALGGLRTTPRQ
jgi:hypothetical protein